MNRTKNVARAVVGIAMAIVSLVAGAGAADAATITGAACEALPGTEVRDHSSWVGCHGEGMPSSGMLIVG